MPPQTVTTLIVGCQAGNQSRIDDLLDRLEGLRCTSEWVACDQSGVAALARNAHDVCLVIADSDLSQGLSLIREARRAGSHVPIIVLAETISPQAEDEALAEDVVNILGASLATPDQLRRAIRFAMDRARQEHEHRVIEREHQLATDALRTTAFEIDLTGRLVFVNPSAYDRWGYTKEDFDGGLSAFDLVASEDRDRLRQNIQRVIAGEKPNADYAFVRKDGSRFWAAIDSTPVVRKGRVVGVAGLVIDITEHMQQDQALRESEERFRRLVELSPDAIFIQAEGRFAFANAAALRLFGAATPDDLIGRDVVSLMHPDFREIVRARIHGLNVEQEEAPRLEVKYLRLDGSVVDVEVAAIPFTYQGRPGAQVMVRDITERKRAEADLRRSEERHRSLVHNALYGMYRSTTDGCFVEVNQALATMLGYDSETELIGQNISALYLDAADRIRLVEQWKGAGRLENVEVRWRRKDGSTLTARLAGRAVHAANGSLEGCEMIVEDVSERRMLEDQFRQAQKMEAVGRLAGGVAHDFNNLLTAILGYSDLLIEQFTEDDPRRQEVGEIRNAADRATALTRQLLAFSRKQLLQPKALDLNQVVGGIHKMLQRLIGEDVDLATIPGDNLGIVRADPGQVEQVIMNLAINARDAMPGGGRLTIETANVDLDQAYARAHQPVVPGPYVMLAVSDTGCGMDAEVRSHLFEPFFTTKERGKGTGLGLATVYGIVKQSGGYVYVYSEVNKGTSVKAYFPRIDATAPRGESKDAKRSLPFGSETILVAEDEDAVRNLILTTLSRRGYHVLDANAGGAALALAAGYRDPIDLLLTDVVMPEMSGRELADRLLRERPRLRVLYISGYTDRSISRNGVLDPGTAFLQKPFTPDGLAQAVRETLDRRAT